MLIKQKRRYRDYVFIALIVIMSLGGGYGLLLTYLPNAEVSIEMASLESANINLRVQGQGLYYTLQGEPDLIENANVVGAQPADSPTVPKEYIHYPAPTQTDDPPQVLVMGLSYPWTVSSDIQHTQFYTFPIASLNLPIVSLIASSRHLFGKKGLYSVKSGSSKEVKWPVHFQYLNKKGDTEISVLAEAEVAGYSSKKLPMKSLNLNLEKPVRAASVFGNEASYFMHSLRLRNGGNDFLLAHMRDAVVSDLSQETHNITLGYQPVAVFMNGEFWGLQYVREHISVEYLREKYSDLERDQIILGELHEGEAINISSGFHYAMGHFMQFVETADFTQPENYDSLTHLLNIPNFTDYIAVQTFVSNHDWPHNNVKATFLNNQLHFLLYDTDFAFNYTQHYRDQVGNYFNWPDRIYEIDPVSHNYFKSLDTYLPTQVNTIFQTLMSIPAFRHQFIHRYRELLLGILSQQSIQQSVHTLQDQLAPLMPHHINRWGYPSSILEWNDNAQQIVSFCGQRRSVVLKQLEALEDQDILPLVTTRNSDD